MSTVHGMQLPESWHAGALPLSATYAAALPDCGMPERSWTCSRFMHMQPPLVSMVQSSPLASNSQLACCTRGHNQRTTQLHPCFYVHRRQQLRKCFQTFTYTEKRCKTLKGLPVQPCSASQPIPQSLNNMQARAVVSPQTRAWERIWARKQTTPKSTRNPSCPGCETGLGETSPKMLPCPKPWPRGSSWTLPSCTACTAPCLGRLSPAPRHPSLDTVSVLKVA